MDEENVESHICIYSGRCESPMVSCMKINWTQFILPEESLGQTGPGVLGLQA